MEQGLWFGMIDAYAATSLALHLKETGSTQLIDPGIQNHLISFNDSDNVKLEGHSWSTWFCRIGKVQD